MAKIFVSYRRQDTASETGRLCDRLKIEFGSDAVFLDIDDILPGSDFREAINGMLEQSQVVLVMIGPNWTGKIGNATPSIFDENDWVRNEVASALTRKEIVIIPVLVGDTKIPAPNELPTDLHNLVYLNAVKLRNDDFPYHSERIIRTIKAYLNKPRLPPSNNHQHHNHLEKPSIRSKTWLIWISLLSASIIVLLSALLIFMPNTFISINWKEFIDGETKTVEVDRNLETTDTTKSTDNVLAVTWQPAFCEKSYMKPECRSLNSSSIPSHLANFSVHGLWPQPRANIYCNLDDRLISIDRNNQWHALPKLNISEELDSRLKDAIPGYISGLHLHGWYKHGSCYKAPGGEEEYFRDTLFILDQLNSSRVMGFISANIGEVINTSEIRDHFDNAFGKGAGQSVRFRCLKDGNRSLLLEIRLHLKGKIDSNSRLGDLMRAADPVDIDCESGIVDEPGLQ